MKRKRIPKVRIARPRGRPYQLRYFCPEQRREVRVSIGTRDEDDAEQQKRELEARLLLGIETPVKAKRVYGPQMPWDEFREEYRRLWLDRLRDGSAKDTESRLDIAERILKPRRLANVASREALDELQSQLLAGVDSRKDRPRSPHTVRAYMASVMAAINWAHLKGWIETVPRIAKVRVSKMKAMKGRPITTEEFERMLERTPEIVGKVAAESWHYLLQGLWQSALRIDELMHVSWDDPNMITPAWPKRRLPVLRIPAALQKNDTEEEIPLLPWFEAVLLETPEECRYGWAFDPVSLETKIGRKQRHGRPTAEWVGKVISRIGKAAGVVVYHGDEKTGRPAKYASAHDLRRSCAERLLDAEVPQSVICRVMRHASWETTRRHYAPGDVQKDAQTLKNLLETPDVPGYSLSTI